jgi:hypothetical protein
MKKRWAIKQLATKTGKRAKDMLVLTQVNDPFYIGSKAQHTAAEWARRLYWIMKRPKKVHIRRLHYFALTQPQHIKPNGQVYKNTSSDWKFLCDACKFARYLQILPYDIFIDRWSIAKPVAAGGYVGFDSSEQWDKLVDQIVEGLYRRQMGLILNKLMPCHIEIWVEKSSAADLIGPVSVARKIEFLTRQYRLNRRIDIKLRPLMLNRQQCKQFRLPGIPMPDNPGRKFKFTRYNGRITTELHALEVTRPGYIRQVVEDELNKHLDSSEILAAAGQVREMIRPLLEEIRKMVLGRCELETIIKRFDKRLSMDEAAYEWRGPWLLDTKRDYMSQLTAYQLHKLR